MQIEKQNNEGDLLLIPDGRIDSLSAGDLERVLEEEITDEIESLTVDMAKVDFISSKGLRILVSAYKRLAGRKMLLINANSSIKDVLKLSGLMNIFGCN